MSSALYELTSIRGLCQDVRQWSSQVTAGAERDRRRRRIEADIRAVVALPERLNTENCIDLIFCAHRIIPLVGPACWGEYLFVFELASCQLSTSITSQELAQRWLEYHDGGINLLSDEIVRLLALIRDAHHALPPASASLVRALATTVVANLIPATHNWQSNDHVASTWHQLNGLFPASSNGIFTFLSCMLNDCAAAAHYEKRGVFQTKADQEEQYSANSFLRLALIKLLATLFRFPNVECCQEGVRCISLLEDIVWEPHYKTRDVILVPHVIRLLVYSPRWGPILKASENVLKKLTDSTAQLKTSHRDNLKDRWMSFYTGVDNFPVWLPSAVHHLLSLVCSIVSISPGLVAEVLVQLASLFAADVLGSVLSEFVICNRQLLRFAIQADSSGKVFPCLVAVCVRDVVGGGSVLAAEALGVLVAELCLCLKRGLPTIPHPSSVVELRNHLATAQRAMVHSTFDGALFIAMLRVHMRHLLCEFLSELQAGSLEATTFVRLHNLVQEMKEFLTVATTRCVGPELDKELALLRQENAIVATKIWRTLPSESTSVSFLSAVSELIALL